MKTIVSEKGQVTIPKALRDALGLEMGTVLDFSEDHGILIGKKRTLRTPVEKWRGRGRLPENVSVDQYLRNIRE